MLSSTPELLCIGHVCHDMMPKKPIGKKEYVLGGTVSFASLLATKMGYKTAVLTSAGADFIFEDVFAKNSILFHNKIAPKTTVFENLYDGEIRTQYIHARALSLELSDIPEPCKAVPAVLFSPIANELNSDLFPAFPDAVTGIALQGCLRKWDKTGKVRFKNMNWKDLAGINLVFLSDADLEDTKTNLPLIAKHVDIVVITHGKNGVTIIQKEEMSYYPSFPTMEVDPTGAGDTFAVAFLLKYAVSRDIFKAAAYAHAAASLIVETVGLREDISGKLIDQRYKGYLESFQ